MKKIILSLVILATVVNADVFDKGKLSVGIVAGSSYSNGENYAILGVGIDYFIINGLTVGIGYRGWFGGNPTQNQLTLTSSYYIPLSQKFRPYVGGFIRETFEDHDTFGKTNYESYGARGGVAMVMSPNSYLSFGYAYEERGNCSENIFRECSSSYPELVFSLAF